MRKRWTATALATTALFLAQVILPVPVALAAKNSSKPSRRELTELRTATRKVYETAEGLEYQLYLKPIHEKDADGKWVDRKERSFRKVKGKTYAVDGLPFAVELSGDDSKKPKLTIEQPGHQLRFDLGEAIGKKGNSAKVVGSTFTLAGSDGASELQYQTSAMGLKETLVMKRPTDQYIFRFPIDVEEELAFASQEDGSILINTADGEPLWRIAPATAEDKKGSTPSKITQTVTTTGDQLALEVTVEPDWNKSPATVAGDGSLPSRSHQSHLRRVASD